MAEEIDDKPLRARMQMTVNMKAVRDFISAQNPSLRTSREFFNELDSIIKLRVAKAMSRQRSLRGRTLKKDALYM